MNRLRVSGLRLDLLSCNEARVRASVSAFFCLSDTLPSFPLRVLMLRLNAVGDFIEIAFANRLSFGGPKSPVLGIAL